MRATVKHGTIADVETPSPISPTDNNDDSQNKVLVVQRVHIELRSRIGDSKPKDVFVHIGELTLAPGRRALPFYPMRSPPERDCSSGRGKRWGLINSDLPKLKSLSCRNSHAHTSHTACFSSQPPQT